MNAHCKCLLALALLGAVHAAHAAPPTAAADGPTYVIPVKGMIERGLLYAFRRGLEEAKANGAGAVVLDMDTPGGKLQAAEEIVLLLLEAPMPTYTFVNPRAISAGAIIALSTDEIYMTPPALIGDAMPIMMSPMPGGGAQEVPEGIREKIMSPTVALVRSAAQAKGHDPLLGEAMVRPELEYKIGDRVVSPEGQLLTLTSQEAAEPLRADGATLLSSGTVGSLEEMLAAIGRADRDVVVIEITQAERIARVIEGFPMSGILMALGLLGLYIEFKTPGFGFPGLAGLLCLGLWFWGHHIAGLAGYGELLLFTIGVVLLMLEIFVIPGFGIAGIGGLALMVAALFMAMIRHAPASPIDIEPTFRAADFQSAILNFGIAAATSVAGVVLLAKVLPKTGLFQRLVLADSVAASAGYRSSNSTDFLLGRAGKAITPLRPAGIGSVDGKRYNVVTRGPFIERDRRIIVVETHGNRIVVESAPDEEGSRQQDGQA